MTSVNFNAAATSALRVLQSTNASLDATQNRISTGLKISEAKDNAAYWSISTSLKSDNKSMATVKDALGLGSATVDTAYQGLNAAKDVLDEIKSKLTSATTPGIDRSKIQDEIAQLQQQLRSIADSSNFSGENWLAINSSAAGYSDDKKVVASFSRDASGAVAIGTIGINIGSVALFDTSRVANADGILDRGVQLKAQDGTNLAFGGATSVPGSSTSGLVSGGLANGAGAAGAASDAATTAFGDAIIFDDVSDVLTLTVTVDGGTPKTVDIRRGTVQTALGDSSNSIQIGSASDMVRVLRQAFTDAGVTGVEVGLNAAGNIAYTSTSSLAATPMANRGVVVAAAAYTNTAGADTTARATSTDIASDGTATTYAAASAKLGTFNGPMTFTGDAEITFTLAVDGGGAVNYTVDRAAVNAALGKTDGKINTAAEMQQVLISVIEAEPTYDVGFAAGDELLVGALADGSITFTSRGTGATSAIAVTNVTVTQDTTAPTPVAGSSTISVQGINISDAALRTSGAVDGNGNLDGDKVLQVLTSYIGVVQTAINEVTSAASNLGAVASRITLQQTFVQNLMDTIDKGVSGLVDADMNEESTKLQALQVKQQLGVQALSIANQSAQNVLSLFR